MNTEHPNRLNGNQRAKSDHSQAHNFESLRQRFSQNIYGTPKGRLRLDLLTEDFNNFVLPQLKAAGKVLDVGCGEAYMSTLLITAGHQVTLLDASQGMLDKARSRLETQAIDLARVNWCEGPLHRCLPRMGSDFDLVIMHALMEWLDEPWQGLQMTLDKIADNGLISLAFYNRNSLIYRNLLQGNFRKINKDNWQQSSTGLTPHHPIHPEQLYQFMEHNGFTLLAKRGIRCFYDFMRKQLKQERSYEDILEMERRYSQQEPFLSLGRYIHGVWKKTDN